MSCSATQKLRYTSLGIPQGIGYRIRGRDLGWTRRKRCTPIPRPCPLPKIVETTEISLRQCAQIITRKLAINDPQAEPPYPLHNLVGAATRLIHQLNPDNPEDALALKEVYFAIIREILDSDNILEELQDSCDEIVLSRTISELLDAIDHTATTLKDQELTTLAEELCSRLPRELNTSSPNSFTSE